MADPDWESVLKAAFAECDALGQSLSPQQRTILWQAVSRVAQETNGHAASNPLEELTPDQREALLDFVQEQEQENRPWKAQLLNDWLAGRDSGRVQFLRENYGLPWLERVQGFHLAAYRQPQQMQVGDRIEVANNLWEWVQEDGPCLQEWFPCTVIQVVDPPQDAEDDFPSRCTVRFENGLEYEIQGIYDWNRYHWRWVGGDR